MQSGESRVESRRESSPSSQLGKSEELDKVFDILLFLLSIVTAVFFQYSSTIYPLRVAAFKPDLTKVEFFQEVDRFLRFDLRMYFIPLFLLIAVWVSNRLSLRTRIARKKALSEFCYAFAFAIIGFDIYILMVESFPLLRPLGDPAIFLVFVIQFLVSFPFIYYYEMPSVKKTSGGEEFRTVWAPILLQAFMISFMAWIILITIFILNWVPLVSQF